MVLKQTSAVCGKRTWECAWAAKALEMQEHSVRVGDGDVLLPSWGSREGHNPDFLFAPLTDSGIGFLLHRVLTLSGGQSQHHLSDQGALTQFCYAAVGSTACPSPTSSFENANRDILLFCATSNPCIINVLCT